MLYEDERQQAVETALSLLKSRLVVNTSGNVSMRVGEHIVITPSGRPYDSLLPKDICVLDMGGNAVEGDLFPSSETPLHLAVYATDPTVNAIVHTHSVHATAVTTLVDELPVIHYQMAGLGGVVPVAPYATFGSKELAKSVIGVLPGKKAVLMKNHGSLTIGDTLAKACARAITLEWCAEVWMKAKTVGEPSLLSKEELERVQSEMDRIESERDRRLKLRASDCTCCND